MSIVMNQNAHSTSGRTRLVGLGRQVKGSQPGTLDMVRHELLAVITLMILVGTIAYLYVR